MVFDVSVIGVALATTIRIAPGSSSAHRAAFLIEGNLTQRAALMSSCALFAGLTIPQCVQLAQSARAHTFGRDELLFDQGEPIRQVFLIESGYAKLTQLSSNGSEVIMWLRGPNDLVDVFGIPARPIHSCSARVVAKCRCLVWDWTILESSPLSPLIERNMGRILSERIGELEERFREVATEKVSNRVACALVRIAKQLGKTSQEGTEIFLCREELAQLTGTTLFTISRLMTKWSELGLVKPRREAVLVRDPDRFLELSATE